MALPTKNAVGMPDGGDPSPFADGKAVADWVLATPIIDGVFFGSSDGEVEGPPVCSVAVAGAFRGYGKGHTQSQALISAVGEALELVAAAKLDETRLIRAPLREIRQDAFDPAWLGLYTPEQYASPNFPFRAFDEAEPLHWIAGQWLDSAEPVYLPAFAVYLCDGLAREALCQVTSNGLAAGFTHEGAVERAVLELYDRDAFLFSWIGRLPKVRVDALRGCGRTAKIVEHLADRGAKTEIYLLANGDPAYVAVAVAIGDGVAWPAYTLGLGAGRRSVEAVERAVLELGQTGPSLARIWRHREMCVPASAENIRTLHDHALYYCDSSRRVEFERWRSGPRGVSKRVTTDQVRVAIVDLTTSELRDGPFRVVRALAKGLQPLHCGYGFERLACERLKRALAGTRPNDAPIPIY